MKQIGFAEVAPKFVESRVDGDLLLQLTEENLCEDRPDQRYHASQIRSRAAEPKENG